MTQAECARTLAVGFSLAQAPGAGAAAAIGPGMEATMGRPFELRHSNIA